MLICYQDLLPNDGLLNSFLTRWETIETREMECIEQAEDTSLLCKGKYHCMADLQFDWFGFGQTSKCCELNINKAAES